MQILSIAPRATVSIAAAVLLLTQPALATEDPKVAQAKSALEAELVDPMSAVYRSITVSPRGVCGEYNAKNKFGGYNGFKWFGWTEATGRLSFAEQAPRGVHNIGWIQANVRAIRALGCKTDYDWALDLPPFGIN